jgi:hypothetical protein
MYLKKSFLDSGKLSRSARTCFALCALLLCSLFSAPALRAAASLSEPFNASYFTSRDVSNSYVQLSIPFYDDRGSDRFLQVGSYMEYYNGTSWTKFLEFDADDESEGNWYWVKVRKTSSSVPYIDANADYSGGWKEITTDWTKISVYRSNKSALSPTYLKLDISMSNISASFGSRPLAFRLNAVVHDNSQGEATVTWYLDNKTSPYQVWHAGGSMHKPSVTGYTINENGTVTVSANISSWNEWDDKGTVISSGYYNAKNVKIDNAYPQSEIKYSCTSSSSWGSVTTSARNRAYFNAAHTIYADNGRYDYQPAYSSILSESYSVPAYPCPSGLTATVAGGTVTLRWNMTAGTSASVADNYQIKYRKRTDAWQTVSVTKGYVYNETNPSVTFDFSETNQGTNSYQFLVARGKFAADNSNYNAVSSDVSINTNKVKATSLNATLNSDNSKVNITWTVDGGKFTSSYKYRLYRKQGANSWTQLREFAVTDAKSYTDDGLVVCDPYYYQLRIYDGSSEYSDISTANAIVRPNTNIGSISDISVSKGYFNDRVNITWKASAGAGFKRYSITRRPLGITNAPEQSLTEITASGLTQYSYEDHTATPGTYYEYKVNAWTECNGENNISQELYSTGFSQPFGVVSGKVSYAGDVAVQGVSIMATGESDYVNMSINFVATAKTAIETPCESSDLLSGAFSWQAYVMLNDAAGSANIQSLFDAAGKYAVEIDNNQVWLSVYKGNDSQYDEYHFTDITLERGVYYQLSVTCNVSGGTGTGILYVDGVPADTIVKTGVSAYTFPTASAADKKFCFGRYWETTGTEYFNGFMDEIRLWKKTLTAEDVAQNYDRYLSGKEEGLALYYRLDETSGDEIFDLSGRNGVYNENHGRLTGGDGTEKRSLNVPDPEQLAIKAITDANGAYILNTVPYTGDGSMYTLTPVLGVHTFNPTNKPLYFNQQSPAYSNVNFTDVSSFQIRGQVVYEGGNYPVAGCSFEVDERPLTRPNGEVVKTDENGEFEITVPIGVHKVQVKKTGHTFANNGLLQANGADLDYNAPLANVKFSDQTRVKLIGRVVGGKIEDAKPLGFGEPVNNIGVQTIKLESTRQQYNFVSTTAKASFGHNQGQWKTFNANGLEDDSTTVDYNEKDITIHVSPATGEFVAMVYPEPYIIDAISVPQGEGQPALDVYTRRESLDLTGYAYPDDSYLQTETRT